MENPIDIWTSEVRDYECDLQGIVNNAVYQNYLEHARHRFLLEKGIDFAALTEKGIYLVVIRVEIDYKLPLRSGDKFRIELKVSRLSKIRFVFDQEIYHTESGKLSIQAKIFTASMNDKGRPIYPREIESLLPKISE